MSEMSKSFKSLNHISYENAPINKLRKENSALEEIIYLIDKRIDNLYAYIDVAHTWIEDTVRNEIYRLLDEITCTYSSKLEEIQAKIISEGEEDNNDDS